MRSFSLVGEIIDMYNIYIYMLIIVNLMIAFMDVYGCSWYHVTMWPPIGS